MAGQKISQYGADQSPVTTDYVLGNKASGPSTATFKLSDLITLFTQNLPSILKLNSNITPVWQYLNSTQINSGTVTTASTSFVELSTLTVQVTVPSGYTKVRISFSADSWYNSGNNFHTLGIFRGASSGALTTQVGQLDQSMIAANDQIMLQYWTLDTPTAGTYYYTVAWKTNSGTATLVVGSSNPASLLVECC